MRTTPGIAHHCFGGGPLPLDEAVKLDAFRHAENGLLIPGGKVRCQLHAENPAFFRNWHNQQVLSSEAGGLLNLFRIGLRIECACPAVQDNLFTGGVFRVKADDSIFGDRINVDEKLLLPRTFVGIRLGGHEAISPVLAV